MSAINKVLTVIMLLIIISASIYYAINNAKLAQKDAEIARLEMTLLDCGYRVKEADSAIARQNIAVEAVRIDTVYVEKHIKAAEKKYVEVREVIVQSLERDSSCENKIDNVDFALRRFHGFGVRPAGGGKD